MRHEISVSIPSYKACLSGTLCLPEKEGVFPTVLMVHGSGALDRDENAKGFKLNIFKRFAEQLAAKGIASLRYDKRGIAKSTGDYYRTGHFDLVEDAMQCLEYLRHNKQCNQNSLFLLGHSEGSIIVPQMAQKDTQIAGIILLTPFIEKIESLLAMQSAGIKQDVSELGGVKGLIFRFFFDLFDPVKVQAKMVAKVKHTSKSVVYVMLRKIPAIWLRELMSLSPVQIYQQTYCDCLIIGGEKDAQCPANNVATIARVLPGKTESYVISGMSHLLRLEEGRPSILNYRNQLKMPIEPRVFRLVSNWILHKTR